MHERENSEKSFSLISLKEPLYERVYLRGKSDGTADMLDLFPTDFYWIQCGAD